MKKFKLLPSMLMLVMCVGVLAVGIYAVSPAQNNVTGTISVIASNPEISITAYYESVADGNEIGQSQTTRTGVEIDITDTRMIFDTSNANTASDVDSKYVVIKLQNNSSVEMGVYFAMSETATSTATTPALNLSGATEGGTAVNNIMEVGFSPYAKLPSNGSVTMQLSFKLLNLYDEDYTIDLSDYTIYLNTETPVNTEYLQTFSITEGLSNNEEKNEVVLGSSNVITSTFTNMEASYALPETFGDVKECNIKVTDKTSSVLTFILDVPQNTCVGLFGLKAYEEINNMCGGDYVGMLLKAAELKGTQQLAGVSGSLGFYATNVDYSATLSSFDAGIITTYQTIEIPTRHVFTQNNTLDMYIVVGSVGTNTTTISMATKFNAGYEDARYILNEDGESYTYYEYKNYITMQNGVMEIPNTVKGLPVTEIFDSALLNCVDLENLVIGNNVQIIGISAFMNNVNLKQVTFSSSLIEIKRAAFSNCANLESVDLSVCKNLEIIGWEVFYECTSLKSVNLSGATKLLEIGDAAFCECTSLESIDLSSCVLMDVISLSLFKQCTKLEVCKLPPYLEILCGESFVNCVSLKEIVLPQTISSFSNSSAFSGCTSLKVYYKGTSEKFLATRACEEILATHDVHCIGDNVTIAKSA